MKITLTAIDRLTPEQLDAWSRFQRSDPALASPYFRPEFVRVASACRGGVEAAVMEEDGKPAGFFPFQREGSDVGRPVAAPLSDFQGVIARPGLAWNARDLIRGCELSVWHFDHLVAAQQAFASCHWVVAPSAYMDLSHGFEAYQQERHDAGYREISQALRKMRKVENQLGPLRFEPHTTDESVFQSMLRWKAQQYYRSNQTDVFQFPWVVELLRRNPPRAGRGFLGDAFGAVRGRSPGRSPPGHAVPRGPPHLVPGLRSRAAKVLARHDPFCRAGPDGHGAGHPSDRPGEGARGVQGGLGIGSHSGGRGVHRREEVLQRAAARVAPHARLGPPLAVASSGRGGGGHGPALAGPPHDALDR